VATKRVAAALAGTRGAVATAEKTAPVLEPAEKMIAEVALRGAEDSATIHGTTEDTEATLSADTLKAAKAPLAQRLFRFLSKFNLFLSPTPLPTSPNKSAKVRRPILFLEPQECSLRSPNVTPCA
jgi:hypothetical protein